MTTIIQDESKKVKNEGKDWPIHFVILTKVDFNGFYSIGRGLYKNILTHNNVDIVCVHMAPIISQDMEKSGKTDWLQFYDRLGTSFCFVGETVGVCGIAHPCILCHSHVLQI